MKKHFIVSLLTAAALAFSSTGALAYDESGLSSAQTLYNLGLLKGNSDTFSAEAMDLDSYATRAQLAVTITRMLGKDEKARYQQNPHPFSDVPDWASDYVGWLYENYLVNGHSDTYFGANDVATLNQFCAMILRTLGYYESEGDFAYENAVNFAISLGLTDGSAINKYELVRNDMVKICLSALKTPIKNSRRTLGEKLLDEKVFSRQAAEAAGINEADALEAYFTHVENTIGKISGSRSADSITIKLDTPLEHYGVRVFYVSSSHPTVTEIPLNGYNTYYLKGKISYPSNSAAGYIDELTVYNIPQSETVRIIVVKSTSEDQLYTITGKSDILEL